MISLEIEIWKSIPRDFKFARNRSSKFATLDRRPVKQLFRRTETDKEHYNLMTAFRNQFSLERESPLKEIIEVDFNVVIRLEREQFFGAEHSVQNGKDRRCYPNEYKPKPIATQVGMLDVQVPKTANHRNTPLYPSTFARGQRSSQAVLNAVTESYLQGVSTRDVETIFKPFGIETLSSNQVSKANKMLDEQFEAWRIGELGEFPYLFLGASYEKMRHNGIIQDVAVLCVVSIDCGRAGFQFSASPCLTCIVSQTYVGG